MGEDVGKRNEEIAEAVRDLLDDGDSVVVSCEDGEVHVRSAGKTGTAISSLAGTHPELYAALVRTSARVGGAGGCGVIGFFILLAFSVVLGAEFLGLAATWNVTGGIAAAVIGFWIGVMVENLLEHLAYRRDRDELLDIVRGSGITAAELFAAARGDAEIEEALKRLKRERQEAF